METLPNLNSVREYFKHVDYSYWQRRTRNSDVLRQKKEIVPRAPEGPSSLPKMVKLFPNNKTARGGRSGTASTSVPKELPLKWPGPSRPRTSRVESSMSLTALYAMKKRTVALEPLLPKEDCIKMLKMLITLRKEAIADLQAQCALLQERNQQLSKDIEKANKSSFSVARESLIQHEQLGNSFAALTGWSRGQIERAQAELRDVQASTEREVHGLQMQLRGMSSEVSEARSELHTLTTYKDTQYPVKALRIATMRLEIGSLRETLQDEREGVALLCKREMETLKGRAAETEQETLAAIAKQHLSCISPVVQQMSSHNISMRIEIEMFRKTIKEVEETNQELDTDIRELKRCLKSLRKAPRFPQSGCSPDMDVILNIPLEEWLPF